MDDTPVRHESPAWGFKADDEVATPAEVLPVRRLAGDEVELCAVPFRLARLALGDVVRPTAEGFTVVRRSGHGTVHVWLGDSFLPRADLVETLVGLGAVVERHGENLLAVDVAPTVAAEVLTALAGYAERDEVSLRLAQAAVAPLAPREREALAARLTAFTHARAASLGADDTALVLERIADGEPVLALEKLLPLLPGHDLVLTPVEHGELVSMAAVAGLSQELLPGYGIALTAPAPGGPAQALAVIVDASREWSAIELQWPDGDRVPLSMQATSADTQSFQLSSGEARLLLVGPALAQRVGPYVVVTGFSYAEIVRRERPFFRTGRVVTDGEIVLGPPGAPDYRADDVDNATARLSERVSRLRDLLAAPGGVKRLTRRWTWAELFLPISIGVILLIIGAGLSTTTTSAAPLALVVVALALIVVPAAVNTGRRAAAGRRFPTQGWIASGTPYGSPLSGSDQLQLQLLLPEDMPEHRRRTVVDQVSALLSRPGAAAAIRRRLTDPVANQLAWRTTSGISARVLDDALPSRAVLHLITRPHPAARGYAVVPRRSGSGSGSVVDVLTIRDSALRTTGLL